jgi:primosomal protein N' (replication factor Y)
LKKFVDVIVPLPIAGLYTYALPESMEENVQTGCRVIVSFGQKKFYTAIVVKVHTTAPVGYEVKNVEEVLDKSPVLLPSQLDFWQWVASYYLCTLGDVYKAAVPSGMKLASETIVVYNPDFEADAPLPAKEQHFLDALSSNHEQVLTQLVRVSGLKNLLPSIKSLLEKGAIHIKEELKRTYKPKTETCVRLTRLYTEEQMRELFEQFSRAPKRLNLLMKYIELAEWKEQTDSLRLVRKKELIEKAGSSASVFSGLVEKGIFEVYQHEIGRLQGQQKKIKSLNPLNRSQQKAFESIHEQFQTKDICLLHGVTSSGKTEIYIHLIQEVLNQGKQVLYLLPEIALTTQIMERLKQVFGDKLGVYHSKFPDAERVELWQKQMSEHPYEVILGVRSSIFLPFQRLGLVIVDEEHENTYKQQDPAPRYHARSAAMILARSASAKVLLGTATPSIESYYHAITGKYGYVPLMERYKDLQLPEIKVVDIQELGRKKMMIGAFSPDLVTEIRSALSNHEQVILFLNRRGFAPMIECRVCGWVPHCHHCDVSLTYHRQLNQLTCHYCGSTYQVPHTCPACGSTDIINRGFGTERIEEQLKEIFPSARIARLDLDSAKSRVAYERIISDFEAQQTDVLIGTQMVSKGLDFDHVSVVGILSADHLLNYPDFRSHEHAFQLMAQVAGRAGRKGKRGLVILQTKSPELPVVNQVVQNDYDGMYNEQLAERQLFRYPPFYRLIHVYLKHRKEDVLDMAAKEMHRMLFGGMGNRVLGPDKPPVARVQTWFIRKMLLKIEPQASMAKVREYLMAVQAQLLQDERFRSVQLYYDVDPQ